MCYSALKMLFSVLSNRVVLGSVQTYVQLVSLKAIKYWLRKPAHWGLLLWYWHPRFSYKSSLLSLSKQKNVRRIKEECTVSRYNF